MAKNEKVKVNKIDIIVATIISLASIVGFVLLLWMTWASPSPTHIATAFILGIFTFFPQFIIASNTNDELLDFIVKLLKSSDELVEISKKLAIENHQCKLELKQIATLLKQHNQVTIKDIENMPRLKHMMDELKES